MTNGIIGVAADGSMGSRLALEWALREAQLRGCGVEVVCAYEPKDGQDPRRARAEAEDKVHATIDDIIAARDDTPLVSWHVVAGDPVDVLVRESERNELLVMGRHDVGGLLHAASRSPDDLVSRLAACPVVIVPGPSAGPGAAGGVVRTDTLAPDSSP
jgi:nucleotide-binding universal stress UspA family protein